LFSINPQFSLFFQCRCYPFGVYFSHESFYQNIILIRTVTLCFKTSNYLFTLCTLYTLHILCTLYPILPTLIDWYCNMIVDAFAGF
jgi:hypothetical protein